MSEQKTVLVPARGIVRETFEDEVVIINLDSGTYYSLSGSGGAVWTALEGGARVDDLVTAVLARYDAPAATVEQDVRSLVERLLSEQLVCPDDGRPRLEAALWPVVGKQPYRPPELSSFKDMQELLRLDPVHDVDETGWPHRPEPGGGN